MPSRCLPPRNDEPHAEARAPRCPIEHKPLIRIGGSNGPQRSLEVGTCPRHARLLSDSQMQALVQIGAAALMVVVVTLVHGAGLVGITRMCGMSDHKLKDAGLHPRAAPNMVWMVLLLFLLHGLQILIYAGFYRWAGGVAPLEQAVHFSLSVYATLDYPVEPLRADWRLFAAAQALVGFLMLGWTIAFLVHKYNALQR